MTLRKQLVATALEWQERFGVAPAITSALSEYDVATVLLGMSEEGYGDELKSATAVKRGYDFRCNALRFQIKANRPSGKPGSKVTKCPKATNYDWDHLIWVLYDREYRMQEAWMWDVDAYKAAFDLVNRLSPDHMRRGIDVLGGVEFVPESDGGFGVRLRDRMSDAPKGQ